MRKLLLSLCASILFLTASAQCSVREISLSQRASASDLIVEGKVSARNSFWNSNHTMIYTSNTIDVYKIFSGALSTTSIDIITEGGIVAEDMIRVEPSLELKVGDVGVFTCETVKHVKGFIQQRAGIPQYEAYASVQGFVKYDLNTLTASDLFRTYNDIENEVFSVVLSPSLRNYINVQNYNYRNSNGRLSNPQTPQAVSISSFSPSTITAGTGSVLTINGSGFGASQGSGTVGFKNADDGGATYINPLATQILSWSNTQITVAVPSNAGTGTIQVTQGTTATSASTLTVSYAHLNVDFDPGSGTVAYQTDHINDNGTGGYTWRMNTGFDGNALAKASFMRAFDSWRCSTGINWTIGATTSINDAVSDGTNVICFDNTAPLPSGVLGVCYSYWSGCASGPTIIWYVNELDIIFDEGSNISPLTWQYGPSAPSINQYDFESVAVHELGHGHQLGHVINNGAIMHYALSNGSFNHTPGTNDLNGANFVQAKSIVANICGPGAMTNYVCTSTPVASFSGTPTSLCAGGSVAFTDQSTNTPTSWSWTFTGGTPSSSTSQNPTITYNTPGSYAVSLTATNASGSGTVTISGYITVNANPSGTTSTGSISCNGGTNGTATVSPSGGTGPYSYNWAPGSPAGDGTVTITGLSAGTYTCTITDANTCTSAPTATVTQPTALSLTAAAQTNISCNGGSNGAASVNAATGGTAGYTYNWTPGNPTGDGTVSVTGLTAGTWTCTVTDANSCTTTRTFSITQPSALVASAASQTNISCNGGSNGAASVSVSGGTTTYSYNWTPGNPSGDGTASVTGLTVGTWTCTVTDANSCVTTQTFNITQPSALVASAASQTNISCNSGSNGAASVSVSGGTTSYSFNWTPGNPSGDGTASVTGLTAGTWTCTVTDANSCVTTQTFNITQPTAITATSSSTPSSCIGSTGSATVSPSGGVPAYTYSWAPSGGTAATATNLAAGSYTCTITDANSCVISKTVSVASSSGPSASISSSTNVSCNGSCDGAATTLASSGTGPYTYAWTPSGGTAATASGLCAGTYTCTVTDANSCTATATVTITQPSAISASISSQTNISCNGGSNGAATVSASGGTGSLSYAWAPSGGSAATASGLTVGTYTCTITDANLCSTTKTVNITQPAALSVSAAGTATICQGSNTTISASSSGGTGAVTYTWMPGSLSGASVSVSPGSTTTYTVTGTDANGCTATSNVTITVNLCGPTSSLPCGQTFNTMNTNVSATNVPGAVSYKFSFYDISTGTLVASRTQASRTLTLYNVSGIHFNTTYNWRVAVDMGSGFGAESNASCTIIFGTPRTTVPCGVSYSNLNAYSAVPVSYATTGFRFTFYDNTTLAVVGQVTQASNYIYFNTVPALHYGNTYRWTVAISYIPTGGGTAFGPESSNTCTITFNAPQAIVPCNGTWSRASGYTAITTVQGAIQYRFSFYQGVTLMGQRTQGSNYIYFNQVAGLLPGQTYNWTVEVQYNNGVSNVFGPPSNSSCPITFNYSALSPNGNGVTNESQLRDANTESTLQPGPDEFQLRAYPNPTNDLLTIDAGEAITEVYIYSITGDLVKTCGGVNELSIGELPAGTYFIIARTAGGMKRVPVVKQ